MHWTVTRRAVLVGGTLLALLALVALASRGHLAGAGGGRTRRVDTGPLIEWVGLVLLVVAAVEIPLIALGLVQSRDDHAAARRRGNWMGRVFATMLVFALAAVAYSLWRQHHHHGQAGRHQSPLEGLARLGRRHSTMGRRVEFDWLPVIVVVSIVLVGAAVAAFLFLRQRERQPRDAQVAVTLAAALDESLDDLRHERDARRAVIAAYARMEGALAAAGLPRRAAEAPLEYLARVLSELLHASAESVARLTALFERAKFSTHVIGPELKEEAIEALGAVREELRTAS